MPELIIHIDWTGPFTLLEVKSFTSLTLDFGLYQIYAHHPVYSRNLVYIGRARSRTFGVRISEHRWDTGSENDPAKVEVYLGRLKAEAIPTLEEQKTHIELAEALLIHAHAPAYNTQYGMRSPAASAHSNVRVLNWGAVRSVHREVSGLMWTAAAETFKLYKPYDRQLTKPISN